MSTKPSELVNFDINNVNVTRPSDGTKDNGYATNAVPPSAEHNWIFQMLSAWVAWLQQGQHNYIPVFTFNDATHPWAYTIGASIKSSGNGHCYVPIAAREGDTLESIVIDRKGDASVSCNITIFVQSHDGSADVSGGVNDVTPAAARVDLTANAGNTAGFLPIVIPAGGTLMLEFGPTAANYEVFNVRPVWG